MNIIEDLHSAKKNRLNKQQDNLSKTLLLLEESASVDNQVLKNLGLTLQTDIIEKGQEEIVLNEKYVESYTENVFEKRDIREICLKYRFFFFPSSEYSGSLPSDFAEEVVKFSNRFNLNVDQGKITTRNFYVMTSPSRFKQYTSVFLKFKLLWLKTTKRYYSNEHSNIYTPIIRPFSNLSLFFEIDRNHYCLVKEWKSSNILLRKIYGYATAYYKRTVAISLLFSALVYFSMGKLILMTVDWGRDTGNNLLGILILLAIAAFTSLLVILNRRLLISTNETEDYSIKGMVTENKVKIK